MANTPNPHQRLSYALLTLAVGLLALAGYAGYALYPRFGLPAAQGASLILLAVAAGIGSFFSPCSFPLLVTLLARYSGSETAEEKSSPSAGKVFTFATALAVGAAAFLLLTGFTLALGGEALFASVTFTSPQGRIIRVIVGAVLITLGLVQLDTLPFTLDAIGQLANPLMRTQARERRLRPVVGFLIMGFAYPLAGFG